MGRSARRSSSSSSRGSPGDLIQVGRPVCPGDRFFIVPGGAPVYLKRMELYGFKSFAEKTALEFGPGITAVVGPNGSGKSNLSDALRWVLGEQNARLLRGSRMEEVIFSGSERRKALNVAEVSVTFDNGDGGLPLEYSEVSLTRRVYRDGSSEFTLNQVPCRLRDFTDLLTDTGIGREAYSVVGQGKIDEILSSRPEDRRGLFEEAAGIVRYKNRKREAMRKLEETNQSLLRVRDVLAELETQVGPLAEQARRAEEYAAVRSELAALEIALFQQRLSALRTRGNDIRQRNSTARQRVGEIEARVSSLEQEVEARREALAAHEEQGKVLQAEMYQAGAAVERLQSRLEMARERAETLDNDEQRVAKDIQGIDDRLTAAGREDQAEQAIDDDLRRQLVLAEGELSRAEDNLTRVVQQLGDREAAVEGAKAELIDRLNDIASRRNLAAELAADLGNIRRKLDRAAETARDLATQVERLAAERRRQEEALAGQETAFREIEQVLAGRRDERAAVEGESRHLAGRASAVRDRLNAIRSRLSLMEEMLREYEGYHKGVRSLLAGGALGGPRQGICGVVAELIRVPAEYEAALEAALGNALQYIVTETDVVAERLIDHLKETRGGRATFLPLNLLRAQPEPPEDAAAGMDGYVGRAVDLVECDPRYNTVLAHLLGRTIVARDLRAAVNIARATGLRARLVTLEGEVISPGGSITGGSPNPKTGGILGRSREQRELAAAVTSLEGELAEVRADAEARERRARELAAEVARLDDERRRRELDLAGRRKDLDRLGAELERLTREYSVATAEADQARTEIAERQARASAVAEEIDALEQVNTELKARIEAAGHGVRAAQAARERATEEVTAAKVRLATLRQEELARRERFDSREARRAELGRERELKVSELESIRKRKEELAAARVSQEADLAAMNEQRWALERTQAAWESERSRLVLALQGLDKDLRLARRGLADWQSRLHSGELEEARLDMEEDGLVRQLEAEYGPGIRGSLREAAAAVLAGEGTGPDPAKFDHGRAAARVSELKQALADLGPVNPTAVEDYRRIRERHDFLAGQSRDLEEASASLYRAIAEIDERIKARFQESFVAIRANFRQAFRDLFGGGQADLALSDKENLLETGVEVVAQPPGKKLQSLSLLSGGERALTAIALLFAVLQYKPSPFCILDEIDAYLDEVNVERFANYLKTLAGRTQFIVITHQKGTMERADVLYGVTMEESGISRMVSVRLADVVNG